MHIPDGFLSPATYLSTGAVAAGAWAWAGRALRTQLEAEAVPRLGVLTALAYGLGSVVLCQKTRLGIGCERMRFGEANGPNGKHGGKRAEELSDETART